MDFEIISEITDCKPIAIKYSINELSRLRKKHGGIRWRKLKGTALIRLKDGTIHRLKLLV